MWKQIEREEIKNYPVGTKIRVNGFPTTLTGHYEGDDYGFRAEHPLKHVVTVFGDRRWFDGKSIVEVWELPKTVKDAHFYISVPSKEVGKMVQELLFSEGYCWVVNPTRIVDEHGLVLVVRNDNIFHCSIPPKDLPERKINIKVELEPVPEIPFPKVGVGSKVVLGKSTYLVALHSENYLTLIHLDTGLPYGQPHLVKDTHKLTESGWIMLSGSAPLQLV